MNSKIYTIFYLPNQVVIDDELHHPVVCGDFEGKDEINLLTDHTKNNIAEKNAIYSELTGIYWVWKNTKQEVTGIVHYRRFFTLFPQPVLNKIKFRLSHMMYPFGAKHPLVYTSNISFYKEKILNQAELDDLMCSYDAILPVPRIFNYTVREHYRKYHDLKDLDLLKKILQDKEPAYLDALEQVLTDNKLYANNMFIMKDVVFQEFMQWWFGLLFEFERRISSKNYIGYQERVLGFMAERLLTVWFRKKELKVKELQLIYFKKLKNYTKRKY